MHVEGNLIKPKRAHKILLIFVKYFPTIIAICYMVNTLLALLNINSFILSNISGVSLLTWLMLYVLTIVFKFCWYHKIFLWYILISDIINVIDFYFTIPINDFALISIHSILIGITLCVILINHVIVNKISIIKNS